MKSTITQYCAARCLEFNRIDQETKERYQNFKKYLEFNTFNETNLLIVEENQSLYGHLTRLWMQTAAAYFGVANFDTLAVGIQSGEIDTLWLNTMLSIGFDIECKESGFKTSYTFHFGTGMKVECLPRTLNEVTSWPETMAIMIDEKMKLPKFSNQIEYTQYLTVPDIQKIEADQHEAEAMHKLVGKIARECLYLFADIGINP